MFINWFNGNKGDVADLKEIDIHPKVTIPEATQRQLYELAVSEVTHARVKELINRGLHKLCKESEVYKQTTMALEEFGDKVLARDKLDTVLSKYPKAHITNVYSKGSPCNRLYKVEYRDPSMEDLAEVLTGVYLV